MNYQEITLGELEKALEKLYQNYQKLLENIKFDGCEYICGNISKEITRFLRRMGINANFMSGIYHGKGTEFSGGTFGTSHAWVEIPFKIKLRDEAFKEIKIIIDGAYAQFFPEITPKIIKDKQRLTIFVDDPRAEEWYKGNENNWRWQEDGK